MIYRHFLRCALAAATFSTILCWTKPSTAQERQLQPETVMIVLHAKPGSEAELAGVLARHWSVIRRLGLVQDAPHLTVRAAEDGNKPCFFETFTWRDAGVPDAAPSAVQAIWADMNRLVEPRNGKPGIEITPVTVVSSQAAARAL
jgi:hypothetical protein